MSGSDMSREYDVRLAKDVPHNDGSITPIAVVRGSVPGAMPNGSFVEKCYSEEGDSYPDGTVGIVISSLIGEDDRLGYQVVFACEHPIPTFIHSERIREIPPPQPPTPGLVQRLLRRA